MAHCSDGAYSVRLKVSSHHAVQVYDEEMVDALGVMVVAGRGRALAGILIASG